MCSKARLILFVGNPCLCFLLYILNSTSWEEDWSQTQDFELGTSDGHIPLHSVKVENTVWPTGFLSYEKLQNSSLNLPHLKSGQSQPAGLLSVYLYQPITCLRG